MQRKVITACAALVGLLLAVRLFGTPTVVARSAPQAAQPSAPPVPLALLATEPVALPDPSAPTGAPTQASTLTPTQIPGDISPTTPATRAPTAGDAGLTLGPTLCPAPTSPTPMPAQALSGASAAAVVAPSPTPMAIAAAAIAFGPSEGAINGVALDTVLVMPDAVKEHVRTVFALGQTLGRNPRAFSKVGDSTMAWPPLLAPFDDASGYSLGRFTSLQSTIDLLSGSFARESAAVRKGMHTWDEFDPAWVNGNRCAPQEAPLACEFRLRNPSVAIIRLGANDALEPAKYDQYMRSILDFLLAKGVVPVLGTKPDRREGPDNTINKIVYRLAGEYAIPVWDYDRIASTVPNKGLVQDKIHFAGNGPRDYALPQAFTCGDSLEDLTALMMLDAVYKTVAEPPATASAR